MKARPCADKDGKRIGYMIFCPGCKCGHLVYVAPNTNAETGASWSFNGDVDKPTFRPNILVKSYEGDKVVGICHSFVTDGVIQFLTDCTHVKSGCQIPLEDF